MSDPQAPIDWTPRSTPLGAPAAPVGFYSAPPPAPLKKRRPVALVGVVVAAVLLLAGAAVLVVALTRHTAPAKPAARPAPTDTYVGPGAVSLPADEQKACALNEQMRNAARDADLTGQGATIVQIQALAGKSAIFDIRFDANMLKDRYDLASAARQTDGADTFSATLELFTASLHLSTDCIKAGYRT